MTDNTHPILDDIESETDPADLIEAGRIYAQSFLLKGMMSESATLYGLLAQIETLQSRNDELAEALAVRSKQIGIACLKHDLTHALECGRCYAEQSAELERVRGMVPRWIPHSEAGLHAGDYWVALIGKPQAYTASFCNGRWTSDRCSLNPNTITHVMRIEAPALPPQPESQSDPGAVCETCNNTGEVAHYPDEIYCPAKCEASLKLQRSYCANQQAVVRESEARRAYSQWTDNQGIHCTRFPSWNELTEAQREEWRNKVRACHQQPSEG